MIYEETPSTFSPRFEVVSCFFEYEGNILLLHRPQHKSQGGRWGVPAGKMEPDEKPVQAIVREIKEETGQTIEPQSLSYYDKIYVNHTGYDFIYHIFHTSLKTMPTIILNELEHQDFCWKSPREALGLPLVDDLNTCITMFYKY